MRDDHVPLSRDPAYQQVPEEFTYDPEVPPDLLFNQFPLNTAPGVRAAWKYISNHDNASQHSQEDVVAFKERVKQAARQTGVDLHAE